MCRELDCRPRQVALSLEARRDGRRRIGAGLLISLALATFAFAPSASADLPTDSSCPSSFTNSSFVEIAGPVGAIESAAVHPSGRYVYATNTETDSVEVLDLESEQRLCPIAVGLDPIGIDVSHDGETLYVANSRGQSISVVDTSSRTEVARVDVPPVAEDDGPRSIAVANNGKAIFTTMSRSRWGVVRELDLSSLDIRQRLGSVYGGWVRASADRTRIGLVECGASNGPLRIYRAGSDSFSPVRELWARTCDVAPNRTGSALLIAPTSYVIGNNLDKKGTILDNWGEGGAAWSPTGPTGYRLAENSVVEIIDLKRFLVAGILQLPDTATYVGAFGGVGRMTVTPDGATLVVITDNGVSLVRTPEPPPTAPRCARPTSTVDNAGFLPLRFDARDVAIDTRRQLVYISNARMNQVEVFDLSTGSFRCPILVGSGPNGLDISADASLLFTANTGGNNISVVDLGTRTEVRRRRVPYGSLNETPRSLAAAANGKVLISMAWGGSTRVPLWQYNPASNRVKFRGDAPDDGWTTNYTWLEANAVRSYIGVAMANVRPGTAYAYNSSSDSFTRAHKDIPDYIGAAAVSADGTRILVNPGTWVFNRRMSYLGRIADGYWGIAFAPSGRIAYRVGPNGVDVVDAGSLTVRRSIPLPDTVSEASTLNSIGRAVLSKRGSLLVVTTDNGLSFVDL